MADTGTGSSGDSGSSTKTRPIVFLDVDGVLCCNHETRLEAAPCAELQRIAESTRAAVVLSTDWRRDPSLSSRINDVLHERRVDCIGATPQLSGSMDRVSRVRPKEILSWLSEHGLGGLHGSTNWVAIDDRDLVSEDGGEALRGRFVQTAFASGLTRELADRAITMLLHGPQPCPEEERPPNVRTLQDLLAEAGVDTAVMDVLQSCATTSSLPALVKAVESSGRVKFLELLKASGISRPATRQAIANAIGRCKREDRLCPELKI
jgi:hypothetical protein